MNCLMVHNICNSKHLKITFDKPPHIKLADPLFSISGMVEILLVAVGHIQLDKNHPMFQKTRFG